MEVSEEVADALHCGKGVVALESTIITHGMPFPQNLKTALSVEQKVRQFGSTPATIGIVKGKIKVGLSNEELEYLSDPSIEVIKTSRRDFPVVIGEKLNGGTTVSGTMVVAHMAGIKVFVTGGIGGVHRGVEQTMDISADLTELGRTPVVVVSSGVKSILDIGRTLEYLETQGVCVCSYGNSKNFPAFLSPKSGFSAPYNINDPDQAAKIIASHQSLGLDSGMLIAVPITDTYTNLWEEIESNIQTALEEARENNISGREITPYVLSRLNEISQGKSLQAKNNATVGSQIAKSLANYVTREKASHVTPSNHATVHTAKKPDVVVVGGSIVDFYARIHTKEFGSDGGTYPGSVQQSFGGVGRNVADCLSRLDVNTLFISAIGKDSHNSPFKVYCKHMNQYGIAELRDHNTATYCAVLRDNGELVFGIGDMDIHSQITPQYIAKFHDDIVSSKLICLDGNVTVEAMQYVCELAKQNGVPVWYEPTDLHKAVKPFQTKVTSPVQYSSPNMNELRVMSTYMSNGTDSHNTENVDELPQDQVIRECVDRLKTVITKIPVVIATIGHHGVVLCQRSCQGSAEDKYNVTVDWFPATCHGAKVKDIVSVSGAGDCMVAAVLSGLIKGVAMETNIKSGLIAAQMSLQSHHAVPHNISPKSLHLTYELNEGLKPQRITSFIVSNV
ncbi:hypothetical protein FSP39_008289 [Pinctada imbricata]|uniref:Carbohydrate kinase PfkB domain-containing protein n=1 Tax=Pinctada imbricata TaxID=66713 RepID=A0AA88XLL7_PINIB|nr:hypothetical protein FSP39_008289 [Pinctada imbricata]